MPHKKFRPWLSLFLGLAAAHLVYGIEMFLLIPDFSVKTPMSWAVTNGHYVFPLIAATITYLLTYRYLSYQD
jgi:hypothetical protein